MKKIKLLLVLLLFIYVLLGCKKDDETQLPEMYISIDGDVRQVNDIDVNAINLSKYEWGNSYDKTAGIQFVLDIFDPEKNAIGDIGSFINNEIELYINVYSIYDDAFESSHLYKTYLDKDLYDMTSGQKRDHLKGRAHVLLRLKSGADKTIFGAEAFGDQDVIVDYNNGKYYVTLKDILVKNVKLSARLILY